MTARLNDGTLRALGRPESDRLRRPERIIQFGTGAFLRGFAEYFVQRANQDGSFDGSVVVVGSTGSGRIDDLTEQDGLYTLVVRGNENGAVVDSGEIITAVSRALAANDSWHDVLAVARDPNLEVVVSNTTEVGIVFDENDQLEMSPPSSYPGKLTALLHERATAFDFDARRGLIILPCELIDANGAVLREIILKLADRWSLGDRFRAWVVEANTFCNTLVDRIVPGTPGGSQADDLVRRFGYRDALLTVAEPYRLWAIEGSEDFARRFPLAAADPGIVVASDIAPYRERKVRILNGAHTASVPAALLAGFQAVGDMVSDDVFYTFLRHLIFEEIIPTLVSERKVAERFAEDVLERFSNPFIRHELIDITFQQTRKWRVRLIPSVAGYAEKLGTPPRALLFGFACFLVFHHEAYRPAGRRLPDDDARAYWENLWRDRSPSDRNDVGALVQEVAANEELWGRRLDTVEGLVPQLVSDVLAIVESGVTAAMRPWLEEPEEPSK